MYLANSILSVSLSSFSGHF